MKKFLPSILLIVVLAFGFKSMAAGTITPMGLLGLSGVLLAGAFFLAPKNKGPVVNEETLKEAFGEFGSNAFTDDSQLSKDFHTAVANFQGNMPKAALAKLKKIEPQCRNDQEKYVVAILTGMILCKLNEHKQAITEYNRAVILNPTSDLAHRIGTCHQRLGELRKAQDSYEFALELDPKNLQAMSALATAYVAGGKYEEAIDCAAEVLELDDSNASAMATIAICYGILGNKDMSKLYTNKAEQAGYSVKKIEDTIKALKQ